MAKAAAESVYSGVGGKERCCKSGLESGAISGCAGADGRPSGVAPDENRFTVSRTRVYHGAVFEIKKEIPVNTREAVHPP